MRGMETMPQPLPAQGCDDANPARAVLVLLALAVPEELHLDAAVLVGVDLLARWARPPRPSAHPGPPAWAWSRAGRIDDRSGDAGEGVAVRRVPLAVDRNWPRLAEWRIGGEHVVARSRTSRRALERELAARSEGAALAGAADDVVAGSSSSMRTCATVSPSPLSLYSPG